ncbi:hypothetical protein ACI3KX_00490 [Microbacterium sp. ZW CA_36]|uniref:hypothetical protein n=1 Tax=Microbacterium sp. ZW CA_36 TaxID=3378078 RepID=UPI0038520FD6
MDDLRHHLGEESEHRDHRPRDLPALQLGLVLRLERLGTSAEASDDIRRDFIPHGVEAEPKSAADQRHVVARTHDVKDVLLDVPSELDGFDKSCSRVAIVRKQARVGRRLRDLVREEVVQSLRCSQESADAPA